MKRKLFMLLCVAVMSVSLTACSGKDKGGQASAESSTANESSAAQESTEAQESSSEDQAAGTENEGWSKEMEAVKTALQEALGENYWPNAKITPEMLEGSFEINADMYDDYFGEMPMISTNVDTILIVKAKEDQIHEVEAALEKYRDAMVKDTMQYPMNLGKIQASRIEVIGSYVCFIQLGADVSEVLEKGEEEVIAHCLEQNELAITVLNKQLTQ